MSDLVTNLNVKQSDGSYESHDIGVKKENIIGLDTFTGATSQDDGMEGIVPTPSAGEEDKFLKANGNWADVPNPQVMTGASSNEDGTSGLVPQPLAGDENKFLKANGSWEDVPNPSTMSGATSSEVGAEGLVPQPLTGDQDKVLQGNGTWGHKLQLDVVIQNGVYGYINNSNIFVPFKSQSDIDAAVAAARVGNATAADVLSGKTFTNASGSGLVGTFNPYSIFTDSNKWTVIYQTQESSDDGRSYSINNIVAGEKYVTFFVPYELTDNNRAYFKNAPVSKITIQNPSVLSVVGSTYVNSIGMIFFEGLSSGSTNIQLTYPIPIIFGGIQCFLNITAKLNI